MKIKEVIKVVFKGILLWEGTWIWIFLMSSLFGKFFLRGTEIGKECKDLIVPCIEMMKVPAVAIAFMLLVVLFIYPVICFYNWIASH